MNHHQGTAEQDTDGFDIKAIFMRYKSFFVVRQKQIIKYCLIVVGTMSVLIGWRFISSPPMTTYSEMISFTFSQSEKGAYPNGAPFSITDVTNRNVLATVWEENNLQSQGVTLKEFTDAVSIIPYADNEEFIKKKYQGMLARKNLTSAEISTIERDFRIELESQARKNALLSMTLPFTSPLSGSLAKKVLSDIPKTWSLQAINQLGVVSIPMADTESVQDDILKKGSPFQILDYFYKSAAQLQLTISRIADYPGGDSLKDPETGLSIEDLRRRVADLNRYWILDFDNYVQQHNKASEIDIRSAEIHLKELKDRQAQYIAEAKTYVSALQNYDAITKTSKVPQSFEYSNGNRMQNGASGVQLDGDSLQRLIDIGSQNKDSDFRQELTRKAVQAELNAKNMDQEILRNERRIQAARASGGKGQVDNEKMQFYTQEIWKQMLSISGSIQRIQKLQMVKFSDADGQLYASSSVSKSFASGITSIILAPTVILILCGIVLVIVTIIRRLAKTEHKSAFN